MTEKSKHIEKEVDQLYKEKATEYEINPSRDFFGEIDLASGSSKPNVIRYVLVAVILAIVIGLVGYIMGSDKTEPKPATEDKQKTGIPEPNPGENNVPGEREKIQVAPSQNSQDPSSNTSNIQENVDDSDNKEDNNPNEVNQDSIRTGNPELIVPEPDNKKVDETKTDKKDKVETDDEDPFGDFMDKHKDEKDLDSAKLFDKNK